MIIHNILILIPSMLFFACKYIPNSEEMIVHNIEEMIVHNILEKPELKLKVQPAQGTYIFYDSRKSTFRMGNEFIERRIFVDKNRIYTTAFINKLSNNNYSKSPGEEMAFSANGEKISGVNGTLEFLGHDLSSNILEIRFSAKLETGNLNIRIVYEILHKPIIHKWIEIENTGGSYITIDSIQVESLKLIPGAEYDLTIFNPQKNSKVLSPAVYDAHLSEGFFLGNEAPGILQYYDIYSSNGYVNIGLTPYQQDYGTEVQLAPNEKFTSPATFIFLFKGDPEGSVESLLEFVDEYISLPKIPEYKVWYESPSNIQLQIYEHVQNAKESGSDVFCLREDWTDRRGDWTFEKNAYIPELSQYVHNSGMKFGLCIDLAIAETESQVLIQNPEWTVKAEDGSDYIDPKYYELSSSNGRLMCLGSEYAVYMAYEIDELVRELGLDYVKLTGAMLPGAGTKGCHSKDHIHRSGAESWRSIYDGLFSIIRYLHSSHWDLIVDISLESYSPSGMMDYALLRNADMQR